MAEIIYNLGPPYENDWTDPFEGGSDLGADPSLVIDPTEGSFLLDGEADVGAEPTVLFSLEASLSGGSDIGGSLIPLFDLDFSVVGESFLVANGSFLLGVSSSLSEESHLLGDISWWAAPGAPPKRPSSNSAATLQQFIDATGVGRSAPRTAPTHSVVVDPNPPRKPQSPR